MNLFDQLNRMGTTVIIASHNTQLMDQFGHARLILNDGQLHIQQPKNLVRQTIEGLY